MTPEKNNKHVHSILSLQTNNVTGIQLKQITITKSVFGLVHN
jgi:hypothetical protein